MREVELEIVECDTCKGRGVLSAAGPVCYSCLGGRRIQRDACTCQASEELRQARETARAVVLRVA